MIAQQVAVSRGLARDYLALTKPRIVMLLLVTALGSMFLASGGAPDPLLVGLVLTGGALASGGANALNHFLDRDIDSVMRRTRNRPVAGGRVQPRQALAFGVGLNVVAFVLLYTLVNPLSAALTIGATLFYVLVYTMLLKRTTPQNIVIGGAAGAVPPLVGWAAVTGNVDLPAVYLFAIIFFWTPPHFWALALLIKDDYARARVPMLPVVASLQETKTSIFLYTVLLLPLTLMLFITRAVGWIYFASALALGVAFVYYAWRLLRRSDIAGAKSLYLYSLLYLALLFLAIIVDSMLFI